MTALTRGPLPARVYWRRRLVLVLVVLGLVVGAARLMGLGADAPQADPPRATQVAADPSDETDQPTVTADDTPSETRTAEPAPRQEKQEKNQQRDPEPVLAEPEGVCADRDVAVTPTARAPVAGGPVTFTLELRSITSPACTWQVSPSTVTVKLTSGDDDIWSSQDCPRAIPTEDVVLRSTVGTEVEVTWSGRRSDDECSTLTDWALPGWYYIDAAALAGEPSDLHFELEKPEPEVVTKKAKPQKKQDDEQQRDAGGQAEGRQGDQRGQRDRADG
ncbi:hypothetical protein [Nocardioides sp. GXQ0305]|uniref:hypothetical protein n=1 Tax=Nocardioides sp. GXQ0305 TaxID=3423912 RepID=UPI003D7D35F8